MIKRWSKQKIRDMRQNSDDAQKLVFQLDQTQDSRPMDDVESRSRRVAKDKILAMAVIRKLKLRQRLRLNWIRAGDANTNLFHLHANAHRRKKFIPSLRIQDRTYTSQEDKAEALRKFYSGQFGTPSPRECTLN
jgi:hypothetical protein